MPSLERIQQELGSAKSIDDFFGKEGIFARLFATTLEQMLEAELTGHLGYEKYEAKGRHSGNNRNGKYKRKLRSSGGEVEVAVPREVCDDVPFVTEILSQPCCANTRRAVMS
jgi:putative transposase